MENPKEILCKFCSEFTKENWEFIDKEKMSITQSKEELVKEVRENLDTAVWIVTEVSYWGMDKEYLRDCVIIPNDSDFIILNINNTYLKLYRKFTWDNWNIDFAKKETRIVEYWV